MMPVGLEREKLRDPKNLKDCTKKDSKDSRSKHHYYTRSKTKQMVSLTSLEDDQTQGRGEVSRDTTVPLLGTDWSSWLFGPD